MLTILLVLNTALTPGVVRPLSVDTVCAVRWGTDSRRVTTTMKRRVFMAYGVPQDERHKYVVDHLIPRELAGADVVGNLWPQLYADAHVKDVVENALHRAVCAQKISLADAQERMRHWK